MIAPTFKNLEYSAAKFKKMFHDLLDQPRRETEALRVQCAAQETRIKQLESLVVQCAAQETRLEKLEANCDTQQERIDKLEAIVSAQQPLIAEFDAKFKLVRDEQLKQLHRQRQLELIQSFRAYSDQGRDVPKVPVRDGMVILHYGQLQIPHGPFKNGVLINNTNNNFTGCQLFDGFDPIDVFSFRDAGAPQSPNVYAGPYEIFVGHPPMYVYKTPMSSYMESLKGFCIVCWASDTVADVCTSERAVQKKKQINRELHLKLPDAKFYIFK